MAKMDTFVDPDATAQADLVRQHWIPMHLDVWKTNEKYLNFADV